MTGNPPAIREASRVTDRACALVTRWTASYTRRMPPQLAARRQEEIASDLWEHRAYAAEIGAPAVVVALSIVHRMVAGMAADLAWARHQGTAPKPSPRTGGTVMAALRQRWW